MRLIVSGASIMDAKQLARRTDIRGTAKYTRICMRAKVYGAGRVAMIEDMHTSFIVGNMSGLGRRLASGSFTS